MARLRLSITLLASLWSVAPAAATPFGLDGLTVPEVGLTRRIVADPVSGVALGGYDPVAYFTRGQAVRGNADNQLVWAGAGWRFENAGNRAAFEAHPEVYAPRFGGYDPAAMAEGRAVAADPALFAVVGGKLYLFRNAESRAAILASGQRLAAAASGWTAVEPSLVD